MTIKLRSGIFFPPIHPLDEDPTLCIQRDLELIEFLDRLGMEEAWVGEHHSGGFELISSPELFIAAAAERTKQIRLGTGVISLPYHHPLMTANRITQLDHQTKGRLMIGVGPGLLPGDAMQLGIDPKTQRDRMIEALEVVLRLLDGERVTMKTDWFELVEASCHYRPYSWPRPEFAVASVVTPSGGRLAGKHGLSMLCLAATNTAGGFDALATNWKLAEEAAAEHGKSVHRENLRLVGPVHIAETRAQARANIEFGFRQWADYFNTVSPVGYQSKDADGDPIDFLIERGDIIVGTPDDAIAMIARLREKQGEFGCFLHNAHNWADFDATKKSYELWQRYVMPEANRINERRREAFAYATDPANSTRFLGASAAAVQHTLDKYKRDGAGA
jgi:limonene 1,2-monooxygenase